MTEIHRVEPVTDAKGFVIDGDYSWWSCEKCGDEVCRYRGQSDVNCPNCGSCYNAVGQRLRDDWRGNPSNYDNEIGDLEGFEVQQLRQEGGL